MDQRIIDLKSTPCSGRRRTRPPIAEVRETVGRCSPCRRTERAKTLCEPLHGTTAKGGSRVGAGLGMLETLERRGIRTRPPPARRYRTIEFRPAHVGPCGRPEATVARTCRAQPG